MVGGREGCAGEELVERLFGEGSLGGYCGTDGELVRVSGEVGLGFVVRLRGWRWRSQAQEQLSSQPSSSAFQNELFAFSCTDQQPRYARARFLEPPCVAEHPA